MSEVDEITQHPLYITHVDKIPGVSVIVQLWISEESRIEFRLLHHLIRHRQLSAEESRVPNGIGIPISDSSVECFYTSQLPEQVCSYFIQCTQTLQVDLKTYASVCLSENLIAENLYEDSRYSHLEYLIPQVRYDQAQAHFLLSSYLEYQDDRICLRSDALNSDPYIIYIEASLGAQPKPRYTALFFRPKAFRQPDPRVKELRQIINTHQLINDPHNEFDEALKNFGDYQLSEPNMIAMSQLIEQLYNLITQSPLDAIAIETAVQHQIGQPGQYLAEYAELRQTLAVQKHGWIQAARDQKLELFTK